MKGEEEMASMSGKTKKRISHLIIGSVLIGIVVIIILAVAWIVSVIKTAPDIREAQFSRGGNLTSFVYDEEGNEIGSFSPTDTSIYTFLNEVPISMQQAVVAIEDARFYEHNGVDFIKIGEAMLSNFKTGSFNDGGTTLTQQLVKTMIPIPSENKLKRKIQEQYLGVQLEKLYSKDTILEYYLNSIPLSRGNTGVEAVANYYFGTSVSELSLSEQASIVAMIEGSTYYDPIAHPDNNWKKVESILVAMEKQGYITEEEREAALKKPPYEAIQEVHEAQVATQVRSYFVDEVYKEVLEDLQTEKGLSELEAMKLIYGGGLKIYTTLNSNMQSIVERYIEDESFYPNQDKYSLEYTLDMNTLEGVPDSRGLSTVVSGEEEMREVIEAKKKEWGIITKEQIRSESILLRPEPQAAFVVTDYRTGHIKALYGGRGEKVSLGFNYATQARRQAGDLLMPLAAYIPALDMGIYTEETLLKDEAIEMTLDNGSIYVPKNKDGIYSEKQMTIKEALASSVNTIACRVLSEGVGYDASYDYLQLFGMNSLVEEDKTCALALGATTEGVTVLELNAAYSTIANEGVYIQPTSYVKVIDAQGNILLDHSSEGTIAKRSHVVIKKETAHQVTDILQYAVSQEAAMSEYFDSGEVAGKANGGKTKDLLFAGYTSDLAATIWSGYNAPDYINAHGDYEIKLWGSIMSEISEGLPKK